MSEQDNFSDFGQGYEAASSGQSNQGIGSQNDGDESFDFMADDDEGVAGEGEKVGGRSAKTMGLILAGIVLLVVLVLVLINGMTLQDKRKGAEAKDDKGQSEVVETEDGSGSEGGVGGGSDGSENGSGDGEMLPAEPNGGAGGEEAGKESPTQGIAETPRDVHDQMRGESEVKSPNFEGDFSAGALVTDRFVLKNGMQYQFVIELTVSKGDSVTKLFYYTAKDGYDGVNIGDALKITYTGDGVGGIAVKSIAKP